ncbi:hypothetical protein [Serratia symbiotica]|uniref:hypothetical protein n=1 Tax=Serratia symbiotica TaxID=138074 RepID=UPI001326A387|nr:hypothetical protein [Serratia symbiotica]QTP13396.1 hypothetical protein GPZ83_0000210 [Serratia symbiotica]
MQISSFTSGLFTFSREEGADSLWNVHYGGQQRFITKIHLDQPERVKDDEYRCIRDRFILQLKEDTAKCHYQLSSADGNALTGFTTRVAIALTEGTLNGLNPAPFTLSMNGKVLGGITLPAYIGLDSRYRERGNAFITSLLPDDILTRNAAAWRAPVRDEILHISGTYSLTGVTHDYAATLSGITPSNYRKYIASESAKNRASISFATWHYLLNRLDVTGANDD